MLSGRQKMPSGKQKMLSGKLNMLFPKGPLWGGKAKDGLPKGMPLAREKSCPKGIPSENYDFYDEGMGMIQGR